MIKRIIEIIVIIAAMAVMIFALLNRSNTKSMLFGKEDGESATEQVEVSAQETQTEEPATTDKSGENEAESLEPVTEPQDTTRVQ